MAYIETNPYAIEIAKHNLSSIEIKISENKHVVTIESFDSANTLVKVDTITLPVFDVTNKVIMPAGWGSELPTGETLFNYLQQAFYLRLNEEVPWIIGEGEIV